MSDEHIKKFKGMYKELFKSKYYQEVNILEDSISKDDKWIIGEIQYIDKEGCIEVDGDKIPIKRSKRQIRRRRKRDKLEKYY